MYILFLSLVSSVQHFPEDVLGPLFSYLNESETLAFCAASGQKARTISLTESSSLRYITEPSFRATVDDCLQTPGVGITPHPALAALETLVLVGKNMGDITPLQWVPNLTYLGMYFETALDDFTPLVHLSKLRRLTLSNVGLTDAGLAQIVANKPALILLNISRNRITSVACLADHPTLQTLNISGNPDFTDEATEVFRTMPGLQDLDLSHTAITHVRALTGLANLHNLNISRTAVYDLEPIRTLQVLRGLNIEDTPVVDLEPIGGLIELISLYIGGAPLLSLEPVRRLTGLRLIEISRCNVADLRPLQNLRLLSRIQLTDLPIESLTGLETLKNLKSIHITRTQVSDISAIAALTSIQFLYIIYTPLVNIEPLTALVNLETLHLRHTLVTSIAPLRHLTIPDIFLRGSPLLTV